MALVPKLTSVFITREAAMLMLLTEVSLSWSSSSKTCLSSALEMLVGSESAA
jgi:hypothetical protein